MHSNQYTYLILAKIFSKKNIGTISQKSLNLNKKNNGLKLRHSFISNNSIGQDTRYIQDDF